MLKEKYKNVQLSKATQVLQLSYNQPILLNDFNLIQDIEKNIPASVNYEVKRYKRLPKTQIESIGLLEYVYNEANPNDTYFTIHFAVGGNTYCIEKQKECDFCNKFESNTCLQKQESVDYLRFTFSKQYLKQFYKGKNNNTDIEKILHFSYEKNFSEIFSLTDKVKKSIEAFLHHDYTDTLENIFVNAQTQIILVNSLEAYEGETNIEYDCKFLENADDREKIANARDLLIKHIGDPITIKALSRKVYINECYLKKGFKELYATTIFDFYQGQRMEHAKYLLNEKNKSVTEVSSLLGYSSISHFSTAFKKHTGLKPCDLLN